MMDGRCLLFLLIAASSLTVVRGAEGDVRLVGGRDDYSGRLEISHRGEWGTVCDRGFDVTAARVVCQQLRLEGGRVRDRAHYGEGRGEIWMSDLLCSGGERYLDQCGYEGWSNTNCRHDRDVGVECSRPGSSSSSSSGGSYGGNNNHGGSYGNSHDNGDGYNNGGSYGNSNNNDGGYNNGGSYGNGYDNGGGYNNHGSNQGGSYGDSHNQGGSAGGYQTGGSAREGDLRIVNGGYETQGRLEIYHDGEWGTICDDNFDSDAATVACRQLGFTGGIHKIRGLYGYGRGQIWLDEVNCNGDEYELLDCRSADWGRNDCSHGEDVGVSCYN